MLEAGPAKRLIIYVNESARWHGHSTYHALLELFRERGLAGATAIRGIGGYTGHGRIDTVDHLEFVSGLPVKVEVVDSAEAIDGVLADVCAMVEQGLVEVQETTVVKYVEPKR